MEACNILSNNVAIRAAVTVALLFVAATPGAAQLSFTPSQCRDALVIGNAIMTKYRISPKLAASFGRFRDSGCDLKTVFDRDTDIDEKAFGEFRVKLIAFRTAATDR